MSIGTLDQTRARTAAGTESRGPTTGQMSAERTASGRVSAERTASGRTSAERTGSGHVSAERTADQGRADREAKPSRTHTRTRTRSASGTRSAPGTRSTGSATGQARPSRGRADEPRAANTAPFVLLIMVLLTSGLVATLWLSTAAAADSYRLDSARQVARDLSEQTERLHRDVEGARSAPALAAAAQREGMVPAGEPAVLLVAPDGSSRVIGDPRPARAAPVEAPAPAPAPAPVLTPAPAPTTPDLVASTTPTRAAVRAPAPDRASLPRTINDPEGANQGPEDTTPLVAADPGGTPR